MKFPRADDKKDYYNLMNEIPSLDANELMRTLAEFSAEMIKIFCDHCNNPKDIIFHGGGTKNLFLMDLIRKKINSRIKTTDAEVESKFVEAAAFAYLAYMERGEIFSPR